MNRGHWIAPPGGKKSRKVPKWPFGRLDEDSETLERQEGSETQKTQQAQRHGLRTLDSAP